MTTYYGNLEFSLITKDDLKDLIVMLAKASVCEHVFFGPNTAEETTAYFLPIIESTEKAVKEGKIPHDHVFILRENGCFIGNAALISNSYNPGNFTLGYNIDEPFWRKGYGDSCCRFLIEYGFENLGARRLSADCTSANLGSRRILEKNGFLLEGVQKNYWLKNGKLTDNLLFGKLK